jgi:hypothetical protein
VTEKYGKSFTFYKQHWISHVIEDIEEKGTTDNYVARPGEGFHAGSMGSNKQQGH